MNFEEESYARLFTKRTHTNKAIKWEGRAVLHEMLYEFDRAGIWTFAGDLAEAIAVTVDLPERVVKVGLERLLRLKVWAVAAEGVLFWPTFHHAQTVAKSDAARQRESRANRAAEARAKTLGVDVTTGDQASQSVTAPSRNVTKGHTESRAVTLDSASASASAGTSASASHPPDAGAGDDEPSGVFPSTPPPPPGDEDRAEPPEPPPLTLQAKAQAYVRDPFTEGQRHGPPETWPEVLEAAEAFHAVYPNSPARLRSRDVRAVRIVERFAQGYSVADLEQAARGSLLDPHLAGNAGWQTIQTVWRDEAQVDRLRALLAAGGPKTTKAPTGNHGADLVGRRARMLAAEEAAKAAGGAANENG